jgi:signal transduction histidine kinase
MVFLWILAFTSSMDLHAFVNIDSVKARAYEITNERSRIEYLNKLVFDIRERETAKALEIALFVDELARKNGDDRLLAKSSGNLGWIYYRLANYKEAYQFSTEAYKISLSVKEYDDVAMSLNNIGALYFQVNLIPEAISTFKEALTFSQKAKNNFTSLRSLNNLANLYVQIQKLDTALYYLNQAKEVNKKIESPYLSGFMARIEGDINLAANQYEKANSNFLKALNIAKENQLNSFSAQLYHRIGNSYFYKGEYQKAIDFLEIGEQLGIQYNYHDELLNTYKVFSKTYEKIGNIDQAFKYQKLFNQLKEDIQIQSDLDRFALFQGIFENEKLELNAQFDQAENEIKLENAEKQVLIIGVSLFIFMLLVIRLLVLNRFLKTDKEKLNAQKEELEVLSNNLKEVNATKNLLFSILGHDLRNPVSQLKGIFDLVQEDILSKEEFGQISKLLKRNVDGLYSNLDNILIWSRSQLEGFRVKKDKVSLDEIIIDSVNFYQAIAEDKHLSFQLDLEVKEVLSDPLLLKSVTRNLISNAIKFSPRNSFIVVESLKKEDVVVIKITDQGEGISQNKIQLILNENFKMIESELGTENELGSGLGLNICKQLLKLIDGKLCFESESGKGTSVSVCIPEHTFISNE